MKVGIPLLSLVTLLGCSPEGRVLSTTIYCGESFCLENVATFDVTKVTPIQDFNRYLFSLPIGQVEIYEGNSPDVRNLSRDRVQGLPDLNAWWLSPTDDPAILIIVGKEWPETLVFSIDSATGSREQLVELLRGLRLRE